ncbi:unnamed protein product [Arctogadus glacialis]
MIATGGILRINARRQASLHSDTNNPKPRKRKKRRRNEVVVVKGKLHLCSATGLVAALGLLILLVGMAMSILGYWYRDDLYLSDPGGAGLTAATPQEESEGGENGGGQKGEMDEGRGGGGGGNVLINRTEFVNGTEQTPPEGFLQELLNRYLYSDRMKVVGPLIMGVGIFLFICANAVLHEERDKKTKVINLRDIYSTVIDLHSLRKPPAEPCSSADPPTRPSNYLHPASLLAKKGEGGEEEGEERNCVFTIYQEKPLAAPPLSHMYSWTSFTLPNTGTPASHSAQQRRLSDGPAVQPRRLSAGAFTQPRRLSAGASTGPFTQPRRLSAGAFTQPRRLSAGAFTQPRRLSAGAFTQPRRLSAEVSAGASTQPRRLSAGASTHP